MWTMFQLLGGGTHLDFQLFFVVFKDEKTNVITMTKIYKKKKKRGVGEL